MAISKQNAIFTYIILVFIWASTPLAIVWSVESMPALWSMVFRFLLALPLTFFILWLFKSPLPLHRQAWLSYLAGSCSLIVSQTFTYMATAYLSSGIIALMFGLAPIIAGLIGVLWFSLRLSAVQWLGMCIALLGLGSICLFAQQSMHFNLYGIALMLMSVSVYCLSIYLVKKVNANVTPFAQATGSILCSTVMAICIVPFIWQDFPTQLPSLKSILALFYTVIMASIVAMFCYFKLVQNISATTLSLTTVLTPIIALVIGAALNHEHLALTTYAGVMVIFIGMALYFWRDISAKLRLVSK
ncbi:DMT family transporter [Acinetobacter puyangensis]|uniref:DMT family transporter n=1 Tax=Acinetobacter puyangensis TaxID=1096779 RepID=UPI003A4D9BF8